MNLYDKINDTRAQNGIGSQLNVWNDTLNKYVILIPLETVPSVVGSTNTVDVDLLTSDIITKIKGKKTIDDKDVEFLWHKDNVYRLSQYVDVQTKFLVSYPDGTGVEFEGTIDLKPDDASSDKLTGTFTIVANSVNTSVIYDVRPLMAKTAFIVNNVPNVIKVKTTDVSGKVISLVSNLAGAQFSAESDTSSITCSVTQTQGQTPAKATFKATAKSSGIVKIKATKEDCGSWTTLVTVIAEE